MHRDVKIGLILGVLLVALVAALFFRRESPEELVRLGSGEAGREQPTPEPETFVPLQSPTSAAPAPWPHASSSGNPPNSIPRELPDSKVNATSPGSSIATKPGGRAEPSPLTKLTEPVAGGAHLPFRASPGGSGPASAGDSLAQETQEPPSTAVRTAVPREHRIAKGDSLWQLAERYLRDGKRAEEIYEANRAVIHDPDMLPVGKTIVIPTPSTLRGLPPLAKADKTLPSDRPAPETGESDAGIHAPPTVITTMPPTRRPTGTGQSWSMHAGGARYYVVQSGDTLRSIARKIYRNEHRWQDLYEANRKQLADPHRIREGMTLRLPLLSH